MPPEGASIARTSSVLHSFLPYDETRRPKAEIDGVLMETLAAEHRPRQVPDRLSGRATAVIDRKLPMDLSAVIAPGAAILPFAAVLALCLFLLSLHSGEGSRVVGPPVTSVSQPIETLALTPASAEESSQTSVPQEPSLEIAGSSPTAAAAPIAGIRPDAVSAMTEWWSQRSRKHHTAPHKLTVSARQYRRHREVFQSELGCPPSICFGRAQ